MSDINITPFVDVMLVLLVIFIVATPAVMSQIQISLPKSSSQGAVPKNKPVFVTLTVEGRVYVDEMIVSDTSLLSPMLKQTGLNSEDTVYIRCDKDVSYGSMVNLMSDISRLGYKVSLVTDKL